MQVPWERVLTAGDRLWFTSNASEKRLRRLQTDRVVTPKTSVCFDALAWQGFEPHESAVKLPPLRSRKLRSHWGGGQDKPHFIDRSKKIVAPVLAQSEKQKGKIYL